LREHGGKAQAALALAVQCYADTLKLSRQHCYSYEFDKLF